MCKPPFPTVSADVAQVHGYEWVTAFYKPSEYPLLQKAVELMTDYLIVWDDREGAQIWRPASKVCVHEK